MKPSFKVRFLPKSLELQVGSGDLIVDEASRSSLRVKQTCRNGVCEVCKARLVSGKLLDRRTRREISPGNEFMLCTAEALSDSSVETNQIYAKGELPVKKYKCQIASVELMGAHVYRVQLELPAGRLPETYAGQYLSLNITERDISSFFSIASPPNMRMIELHIQADPHLESAFNIIQALQELKSVEIELPKGQACLTGLPKGELIMLAAGTGFAQMKSIIEYVLAHAPETPMFLYWGVRELHDMYLRELAEQWARDYPNFCFSALVAESDEEHVHYEQLARAVLQHPHQFEDAQFFISGSPRLVYSSMDLLEQQGVSADQFSSDVFEYAPREV